MRPCLDCGELSEDSRCELCAPTFSAASRRAYERDRDRATPKERGYGPEWQRLSARARRIQDFCTDCGGTEGLQADHLPSAHVKQAQGERLTLADVEVVCGPCNNRRGSSRPGTVRASA